MLNTPRSCRISSAAIVSGRIRLSAKATSSGTCGFKWWHTMSISRCSAIVLTVYGLVGLVEEGRMLGKEALRMIGMDRATRDGSNGILNKSSLVNGIRMNRYLYIVSVGDLQAAIDSCRRRSPVLVKFEAASTSTQLFCQGFVCRSGALAQETEVHRPAFSSLEHTCDIPCSGCAGGGVRTRCRSGASTDHGGNAVRNRLVYLLGRDEVDMTVDPSRRHQHIFARDYLGARAYHQFGVYSLHRIGVASFTNLHDTSILNANIAFNDAPVIDNQRVGNDKVERAIRSLTRGATALPHTIANDLASTKSDLVAIHGEIFLYLDQQFGIRQAHTVTCGRAVQVRIRSTWYIQAHMALLPG